MIERTRWNDSHMYGMENIWMAGGVLRSNFIEEIEEKYISHTLPAVLSQPTPTQVYIYR